jgi:hypothetical protein
VSRDSDKLQLDFLEDDLDEVNFNFKKWIW